MVGKFARGLLFICWDSPNKALQGGWPEQQK